MKEKWKEVISLFKELPDISARDVGLPLGERDEHILQISIETLVEQISFVLKSIIIEFVAQEILGKDSGFPQRDGTFALFKYKFEQLKNLNYDNFTPQMEAKLVKMAILITMTMLGKLEK
ncbi:hypothetical protein [Caldisericum sp.]|uniref:hypothetical protein n=1 Tax=Caldisericum sp. TaxID=2499687 RepID=UPI003D09EE00